MQLCRIGIFAHLLVGGALLVGGHTMTAETSATLYGAVVTTALVYWAWPLVLALWHQPALEALRRQRGGTVEHAGWLAPSPALRFEDDALRGRLELHVARPWPTKPVLVARVVLRASSALPAPSRLFVRLARRPGPVPPHARASAPLGDPAFDAHLVYSAGSPAQAEALIARGIRAPLIELLQVSANLEAFEVSYDGDALIVTRSLLVRWQEDWAPWAFRLLDRTARRMLEVIQSVEALTDEDSAALTLENARLDVLEGTQCLVCAGALEAGRAAVCQTCETPHHLECWVYNGMCALFGCGSTLSREQVISGDDRRGSLDA